MLRELAKRVVPESLKERVRDRNRRKVQAHVSSLPSLSLQMVEQLLEAELGLTKGDLVFVHSSVDRLNLEFPFFQILGLLRKAIGPDGTLVFPTYPRLSSYRHLQTDPVFDIQKSPSYTGVLSEFARRQKKARRSLHPTKSVCAIGPLAEQLVSNHALSALPYSNESPYFRVIENRGKVIGLGVGTFNLSLVHCVDDHLQERFPVAPYHPDPIDSRCIDHDGEERIISTFAHDMRKMDFDIPQFMSRHIDGSIARDITISGQRFFSAEAAPLFAKMSELALNDATIYRRRHYRGN
mgnify:CR=1 FL=1